MNSINRPRHDNVARTEILEIFIFIIIIVVDIHATFAAGDGHRIHEFFQFFNFIVFDFSNLVVVAVAAFACGPYLMPYRGF